MTPALDIGLLHPTGLSLATIFQYVVLSINLGRKALTQRLEHNQRTAGRVNAIYPTRAEAVAYASVAYRQVASSSAHSPIKRDRPKN